MPELPDTTNRRVFAETWAALSVGVLVLALAVILWFRLLPIAPTLLLLVIGYLAIESFAQRRVETLLLRITVILAAIATILLAFHYLRELLLVGLGALGLFILVDNAGEIVRARRGRRKQDVATVLDAAGPGRVGGPGAGRRPAARRGARGGPPRAAVGGPHDRHAGRRRRWRATRSARTRSLAPDGLNGAAGGRRSAPYVMRRARGGASPTPPRGHPAGS